MKVVVGLGNPGKRYSNTPHNVGWQAVDELANRLDCGWRSSVRFSAHTSRAKVAEQDVLLVKPRTYMNNSGIAAGAVLRYYRVEPADMVVLVDDADLEIGRLRVRARGTSGGHRGLDSIVREIGTKDFARVRIGVGQGRGGRDLVDHVLSPFGTELSKRMATAVHDAADAVICLVESGVDQTMNQFNAKRDGETE